MKMEMSVSITAVGQNAVVIVTCDDGEPPHAYTIAEIRDWVSEKMDTEISDNRFSQGRIVDMILEHLESDLIDPV